MTGFTRATIATIIDRADYSCEVARDGCTVAVADIQHRRPRGTGGTSRLDTNGPANGLAVCRPCHTWIERNLAAARVLGWSLSVHEPDPASVWVLRRGEHVWLHDDGTYSPCDVDELDAMALEDATDDLQCAQPLEDMYDGYLGDW